MDSYACKLLDKCPVDNEQSINLAWALHLIKPESAMIDPTWIMNLQDAN